MCLPSLSSGTVTGARPAAEGGARRAPEGGARPAACGAGVSGAVIGASSVIGVGRLFGNAH